MYFAQDKNTNNSSLVRNIFIILNGEKPTGEEPPEVEAVIYHKPNNTFSVDIRKDVESASSIGLLEHNVYVDDTPIDKEAGLELCRLLTNDYQLKNGTSISDVKITNDTKLQPRRSYEY